MAAIRIGPINLAAVSRQLQFQSARTRCVNCSQDSGTDKVHVTWDEIFVFEVQSEVRLLHYVTSFLLDHVVQFLSYVKFSNSFLDSLPLFTKATGSTLLS